MASIIILLAIVMFIFSIVGLDVFGRKLDAFSTIQDSKYMQILVLFHTLRVALSVKCAAVSHLEGRRQGDVCVCVCFRSMGSQILMKDCSVNECVLQS